jgi:transposase
MARPTKLTEKVHERILQAIRAGNYVESAAVAAGIAPSTFYRWLERGRVESGGIYHALEEDVRRAEAEAEVHAVAVIRKAMPGDWRAAMAYLERRHPARWRRRESRELTGPDGGAIRTAASLDLTKLTDEELCFVEELRKRAADGD